MRAPHLRSFLLYSLSCLALAACGGGGGSSASSGSSTASEGSLSNSVNPCAPNLCVDFHYPTAVVFRQLSASVKPHSTGGVGSLSAHYSLTSGSLPAGLTLNSSTGEISGVPTQSVGSMPATLQITVDGYTGSLSTNLLLTVQNPSLSLSTPRLLVGNPALPISGLVAGVASTAAQLTLGGSSNGQEVGYVTIGSADHAQFSVAGSVPLPPGLTLNADTGAITGTPTTAGVWFVPVQASVTTQGIASVFPSTAALVVNAVIAESAGQTASVVRMPVVVEPGVTVTPSISQGGGNTQFDMRFDAASSAIVITPGRLAAGYRPGSYPGAYAEGLQTSAGTLTTASYVEVVDSTLLIQ
jgi:hypothetical protein